MQSEEPDNLGSHRILARARARVAALLDRHAALWGELSYRGGITDGKQTDASMAYAFQRYPDRFLIGSDTWINERWMSCGDIIAGYRRWLVQLPPEIAARIARQREGAVRRPGAGGALAQIRVTPRNSSAVAPPSGRRSASPPDRPVAGDRRFIGAIAVNWTSRWTLSGEAAIEIAEVPAAVVPVAASPIAEVGEIVIRPIPDLHAGA